MEFTDSEQETLLAVRRKRQRIVKISPAGYPTVCVSFKRKGVSTVVSRRGVDFSVIANKRSSKEPSTRDISS